MAMEAEEDRASAGASGERAPVDDGSPWRAASGVVAAVSKGLSIVMPFVVAAYVVGWVQAKAYFGRFGASWLASRLGLMDLISFSSLPLVALGGCLFLAVVDFDRGAQKRLKRMVSFIKHFWIWPFFALPFIGVPYLEGIGLPQAAALLLSGLGLFYMFVSGATFEIIVIHFRRGTLDWGTRNVLFACITVILGFVAAPLALGHAGGIIDRGMSSSGLPIVTAKGDGTSSLRLLWAGDSELYVADLVGSAEEYPRIRILSPSQVLHIQGRPHKRGTQAENHQTSPPASQAE
jgi:hypothetical protein